MRMPAFCSILTAGVLLGTAPVSAGLIDCKVVLCLAGGFPTGCADAHRYMMDRITARPPKPPFGTCHTVSLEGEEQVYDAARGWLETSEGAAHCVAIAARSRDEDGGWCTRRCTEINYNVALDVHIDGQRTPYSTVYTYATGERCEDLTRQGRPVRDGR